MEQNLRYDIRVLYHQVGVFEGTIKHRDFVEIFICSLLIFFFIYLLSFDVSIIFDIGCLLEITGLVFIIGYLRYKRLISKVDSGDEKVTEYLNYWKDQYEKQIKLLSNALWWDVLPGLTGIAVMMSGMIKYREYFPNGSLYFISFYAGLIAFGALLRMVEPGICSP
ncbi:MAG: hypothetical protein AB1765_03435 [Candidatus Hydrogenedentota bacterium]